jgi:hypothetical protein
MRASERLEQSSPFKKRTIGNNFKFLLVVELVILFSQYVPIHHGALTLEKA